MHAEIIAIGDEIASGELLDTNTQWLSQRLEEMGIRVLYHTAVGDELDACAGVFRDAIRRADVVVATGGLGPTADDLTREAIARAVGRKLVLSQEALEHVRGIFARRKRNMPQRNQQQAMFPTGSRMIRNPNGTAPGVDLEVPRPGTRPCRMFALPGVPAEIKEMWYDSLADALREAGGGRGVVRHRRINCFGKGESDIEAILPDLIRRGRTPRVGINASQTTIILRITAEGATEQQCDAAMEPTVATIRACLGNLVFGEDDDQLQDAVVRLLRQQERTLATAEWGTAGLVAQRLDGAAEAEGHYLGGLVAASETALKNLLDVQPELLGQHSTIGGEVARAMAVGCRARFGSDYALAVGRFPEFDPGAPEPKSACFALAGPEGVQVSRFPYAGHPATLKILCTKRALNMVRLAMLGVS
jgi:nicotinamide-nucleotide amidase